MSDWTLANFAEEYRANVKLPDYSEFCRRIEPVIPTVKISAEDTFAYQLTQQTKQIIEKSEQQINLLTEQNEHLRTNLSKLEDLYKLKEAELEEAKQDAAKAKRYNVCMMIISILSMLIAAAAWLLPDILGGLPS